MRERYGDFLRNFGNVQRRFDMKDDSFESAMQQYSPNEPNFTHFLQEIKVSFIFFSFFFLEGEGRGMRVGCNFLISLRVVFF